MAAPKFSSAITGAVGPFVAPPPAGFLGGAAYSAGFTSSAAAELAAGFFFEGGFFPIFGGFLATLGGDISSIITSPLASLFSSTLGFFGFGGFQSLGLSYLLGLISLAASFNFSVFYGFRSLIYFCMIASPRRPLRKPIQ